jgi:hypothetical protein
VRGGGEWVDGAGVRHVRYPPGGGFAPL